MHGRLRQGREMQHKGGNGEDDDTADGAGEDGQPDQFGGVFFRALHVIFPHYVAEQDAACAGGAEAQHRAEVADHHHKRVGSHRVRAQMPENHGIHGEGHAPGDIVSQGRQRQVDKIFQQHFIADEQVSQVQFKVFAEHGYQEAAQQLHDTGEGGGDGHAGGSQLRCAEQAEDKDGVQQDVQ